MAKSVFEFTASSNKGTEVSLADYKGKVLLIVNTASKCGFTPQYTGLEELYKKYGDRGLVVLGFPCDQFAHQEPGSDSDIAQFCQVNFGVTFPLMAKIEVNGKGTHPLWDFLKKKAPGAIGGAIKWNFTKFLVDSTGENITRFAPTTEPSDLAAPIEALLKA